MVISKVPRSVLAALLLAFAAPLAGCTVQTEAPAVYAGYEPVYYDGYVVYYDTAGAPYYYYEGDIRYVPRTYVYYDSLVDHYHVYRPYYHRWYVSGGYRYKRYHSHSPTHVVTTTRAGASPRVVTTTRVGASPHVVKPGNPGQRHAKPHKTPKVGPRHAPRGRGIKH